MNQSLKTNRLEKWLVDWYLEALASGTNFTFKSTDSFNSFPSQRAAYEFYLKKFQETGTIEIWTGSSDSSIYSLPIYNHIFRCWHDYVHLTERLDFSYEGETQVYFHQKNMLPPDWVDERMLVEAELLGQLIYHQVFNEFPKDQKEFTSNYLQGKLIKS